MPHYINEKCVGCVLCVRYCPVDAISGKKRQLHIINPAICIDCGVCGRVCAFEAVVDGTGHLVTRQKPAEWARPVFDYKLCVACNLCIQVCPTGVIDTKHPQNNDRKDILPWLQDYKGCIGCSFCTNICPTEAISMQDPIKATK